MKARSALKRAGHSNQSLGESSEGNESTKCIESFANQRCQSNSCSEGNESTKCIETINAAENRFIITEFGGE